jgi:O-antigen/teichoic acid export membrane protein
LNLKAISFIKKMSYAISSNLISFIVSALVVLIIPKLIGVEEYGYWQLYIFYSSYVGFLHFGWNDGIYLRFGGEEYKNLNKRLFFSQFIQLSATQISIGIFIWFGSTLFVTDLNRDFIIKMVSIVTILMNTRYMLFFILQATNRIKEYARLTMLDRIVYIFLVIIFLLFGVRNYKLLIFADLVGKFISLFFAMLTCKNIVFNKVNIFYLTISETIENINVGIKLMFANIASMLIIGVVRFGIESTWDVATFGKVSLTLSISNMMMIFINAVGIIMFPILRRTNQDKLASVYSNMRDFLMVLLLGILLMYYPIKSVITSWLPQYADSLLYMALVFPMFLYEGKMALLINTYLKTLRKEKVMLRINLISMCISIVMTVISTQIVKNLDIAILNIVILLALRSALAESYLAKELNITVKKDILLEVLMTSVFIFTGWFVNSWITMFLYGLAYILYLLIKRKDITRTIHNIKSLIKA